MVRGVEAVEFGRESAKDGELIGASSRANPMPESSTQVLGHHHYNIE
jgi:hypothetical protein